MIIYNFDTEERLSDLERSYHDVKIINGKFSDCRKSFREFAKDNDIDFNALEACCKCFERNLLIDAYTYSEQLIKNLYYHLLNNDSNNEYILTFINKKIPDNKFSPNVNYKFLEQSIQNELMPEFKFTISDQRDHVKSYNELISSRHKYAHSGFFSFSKDFDEVIAVEKFITKEVEMIAHQSVEFRLKYQRRTEELVNKVKKLANLVDEYSKSPNNDLKKKIRNNLKSYRDRAKDYYTDYKQFYHGIDLVSETYKALAEISNQDLRKQKEIFDKILNLDNAIKRECIRSK